MKYEFKEELQIAYAVCEKCNNKEFIVSGQTQVCNNCKKLLFRTIEKKYRLKSLGEKQQLQKFIDKTKIDFPKTINIAYACCNSSDCNYGEEVVCKNKVICQYCMNEMKLNDKTEYILS